MSLCAIIPAASVAAARAALATGGYGPDNFSVPVFDGVRPGWAGLHVWDAPSLAGFIAEVKLLPGAIWEESTGEPAARFAALCAAQGATWGDGAPNMPQTGVVTPGLRRDANGDLWWVIQTYNVNTWPNPSAPGLAALVRKARTPGVASPWIQPIDQFDAYKVVDAFTGFGEVASHNGSTWRVTQGDGAGNNIWEPGVFGWAQA